MKFARNSRIQIMLTSILNYTGSKVVKLAMFCYFSKTRKNLSHRKCYHSNYCSVLLLSGCKSLAIVWGKEETKMLKSANCRWQFSERKRNINHVNNQMFHFQMPKSIISYESVTCQTEIQSLSIFNNFGFDHANLSRQKRKSSRRQ